MQIHQIRVGASVGIESDFECSICGPLESATSEADRRTVVQKILALYRGMGSLQDLVLQNPGGVRAEQAELDTLRSALFDEARRQIR